MANKCTITLTNRFADDTTRQMVIGTFAEGKINPTEVKNAVKALNADPSAIQNLYLSDTGAQFVEVKQLKYSVSSEVVII